MPRFDLRSWAVRWALVAAVLFILTLVGGHVDVLHSLIQHGFAFMPGRVLQGEIWTPLTYAFWAGSGDPVWSLLSIFFFASIAGSVESTLGSKDFLKWTLGSVVAGAILTLLVSLVFPIAQSLPYPGFSAAFTATTILYARSNPSAEIRIYLVLPVSGRMLELLTLAILVLYSLSGHPVLLLPEFGAFFAAECYGRDLAPRRLWMQWRARQIERDLRKRSSHLTVIPGGNDGDDDEPKKPRYLN
jgi:hypothetical protein